MKKRLIVVCAVLLSVLVIGLLGILNLKREFEESLPRLTADEQTQEAIGETMSRIQDALKQSRHPVDLADLPMRPGYHNRVHDGWNRELRFQIESMKDATKVSVMSAGPDGVFGSSDDLVEIWILDAAGALQSWNR